MVNINKLVKTDYNAMGIQGTVNESKKILQDFLSKKNRTGRDFKTKEELISFYKNEFKQDINLVRIEVPDDEKRNMNYIYDILPYTGSVRIIIYEDGIVISDEYWDIDVKSRWWNTDMAIHIYGYVNGNTIFEYNNINAKHIIYFTNEEHIPASRLFQSFRDGGLKHCVLTPIHNWAIKKYNEVKTKSSKKNYRAIINKINKYLEEYKNGVPEDKLQEICNEVKINIEWSDILRHNTTSIKSEKAPYRTFKYLNTRENHLDEYVNNSNDDVENICENEMEVLVKNLIDNNKFFLYTGMISKPYFVITLDKKYKIKNDEDEKINEFFKQINIFKMTSKYDYDLFDFINMGVNFNSHTIINKDIDDNLVEWDMKYGYGQHKKCPYYLEFPTIMSPVYELKDYTIEDVKKYIGYYYITIKKIPKNNKTKILRALGINENTYIFDSPFIWLLYDLGYEFTIEYGSYCYKSYDIEFTKDIIESKLYRKIVGKMKMENRVNRYKMIGDEKFAMHLASYYDVVKYNKNTKDIIMEFKNDNITNFQHIAGYFTSYCRINTLLELFKVDYNDIYGWKLDGFIIRDKNIKFNEIFRQKPVKTEFDWGGKIFYYVDRFINSIPNRTNQYIFHSGKGGTGKTHSILTKNKGALFVSYNWGLATNKQREYGNKAISLHKLLGIDIYNKPTVEYLVDNLYSNQIAIDEATQFDNWMVEKIIEKYPYTAIDIIGDIDKDGFAYQCKFPQVKNLIKLDKFDIKTYTKNYRTNDNELKTRMNKLRKVMKQSNGNISIIKQCFIELFNDRRINPDEMNYNYKNDWILVSTTNDGKVFKSQTKEWSNKLKGKKYLCIKHNYGDIVKRNRGDEAYLNGDIVCDIEPSDKFEQRDAFTIHGFQGKTINEGRLFIDMRNIFDYAQLYTAVSRVKFLNQIYILY